MSGDLELRVLKGPRIETIYAVGVSSLPRVPERLEVWRSGVMCSQGSFPAAESCPFRGGQGEGV